MLIRDKWKELGGTKGYVPTGKEVAPGGSQEDLAYWVLASRIGDAFGSRPATVGEIYYSVTRPMGMSSSDTVQLVQGAKKQGYLKVE